MSLVKDNKNFIFRVVVVCLAVVCVIIVLGLLHGVKKYGKVKQGGDYFTSKHFRGMYGHSMKSSMFLKDKAVCMEQCGITDITRFDKSEENLVCIKECVINQLGTK